MAEPLAAGPAATPIPRLDHAIHAALLLAYLGLRSGDRVGVYNFDSAPRFLQSPEGTLATFPRLLQGSARIEATTAETNHTRALAHLSAKLRRRSLIVLFTEFVDSIAAQLMVEYLERLSRRHLVLFATLGDGGLLELRQAPPTRLSSVYQAVVADELWRERQVVLTRLKRAGIQCIDAPPAALSAQLLNRYLEIKRREMV